MRDPIPQRPSQGGGMKSNPNLRAALAAVALGLLILSGVASAQDVGGDIGGGAGIFKPKNPETKRRTTKPATPVTKPANRSTSKSGKTATSDSTADRVEDLLEKGNVARDAKKYAQAEGSYQAALKLRPRDARAAHGLGNVYADQERWDDAEKAYREAIEWNPSDVDAMVALSVVLVLPRTGASNAKRFADAEALARRAVLIQPNNAAAWDRLGVALQSRGLFTEETERAYRRAVELDPQFAVAYAHLARVVKRRTRLSEAAPLYDRATELAKDAPTLVLIADALQAEQLWENSEPVLKRALGLDARNPSALIQMGRMLVVLKRYQDSESYLKKAVEVSPRGFQPYNLLGRAYLGMGRYEDAEKTYSAAVELASPGDQKQLAGAFGFEGVGDGYLKAKRRSDAARAYRRALELDPGNKDLEKKLSKAR